MALFWENELGELIENDDGELIECDDCPCESSCVAFDYDGLWTNGPWGTAEDDDHVPIPEGTCAADPHYSPFVNLEVDNAGYAWVNCDGKEDTSSSGPVNHDVTTTFTLPASVDETRLFLYLLVNADDQVTDILVNGVSTGQTVNVPGVASPISTDIILKEGFQAGLNTIVFKVNNVFEVVEDYCHLGVQFLCWGYKAGDTVTIPMSAMKKERPSVERRPLPLCQWLGEELTENGRAVTRQCLSGCPKGTRLKVFACEHPTNSEAHPHPTRLDCKGCGDYEARNGTQEA